MIPLAQPTTATVPPRRRLTAAAIALLGLAGCSAPPGAPPARTVELADFARGGDEPAPAVPEPQSSATTPPEFPPLAAGDPPPADSGEVPPTSPAPALTPGVPVLVDSLVGQVNGRPIFAHAFFEPIADELRATAARLGPTREFAAQAHEIIRIRLQQVVLDELFLAEAESGLTAEQQLGLFALVRDMRENLVGRFGGVRSQAEEALREQEGLGVEEYVGRERDQELLRYLFAREIQSRVVVSWRDIEREYQRRYDEFNPPATALVRRIRLHAEDQADLVSEVQRQLDAGERFESVAAVAGQSDGGRWQQFQLGPEGLAGINLREDMRAALAALEPGGTTPPLSVSSHVWWLNLEAIDGGAGRSLYDPDVQRTLRAQIEARRRTEEQGRYVSRLLDRGIYDEIEQMHERLLAIAVARFAG